VALPFQMLLLQQLYVKIWTVPEWLGSEG
jgi:hypothetical protein